MRLSRKKAIELCIKLWTWLAETGKKTKRSWPKWEKYGKIKNDCWFCEHLIRQQKRNREYPTEILPCSKYCIYYEKYGSCQDDEGESIFDEWDNADTPKDRKKYAKLFLEQIKATT